MPHTTDAPTFEDALRHAMALASPEQRITLATLLPGASAPPPATPFERLARRIALAIDDAGDEGLTLSGITRRAQLTSATQRAQALRVLLESGDYECEVQHGEGSGRPCTIYRRRVRTDFDPGCFSLDAVRQMLAEAGQVTTLDIRAVFGDVPGHEMADVLSRLREGGEVQTSQTSQEGRSTVLLAALPGLKAPAPAAEVA